VSDRDAKSEETLTDERRRILEEMVRQAEADGDYDEFYAAGKGLCPIHGKHCRPGYDHSSAEDPFDA
jgi:hypothetical protein